MVNCKVFPTYHCLKTWKGKMVQDKLYSTASICHFHHYCNKLHHHSALALPTGQTRGLQMLHQSKGALISSRKLHLTILEAIWEACFTRYVRKKWESKKQQHPLKMHHTQQCNKNGWHAISVHCIKERPKMIILYWMVLWWNEGFCFREVLLI